MTFKNILLPLGIMSLIYTAFALAQGGHAIYSLKKTGDMDELTKEDVLTACAHGEYQELLIKAGVSGGGLNYTIYIFEDGNALLRESIHTNSVKADLAEHREKGLLEQSLQPYIKMVESLPEGEFDQYYKSEIAKKELSNILESLAEDKVFSVGRESRPGHGLGFWVDIYLNGKGKHINGWMYEAEPEGERNVGLKVFLEENVIPIILEHADEILYKEYIAIERDLMSARAAKVSYIELSYE